MTSVTRPSLSVLCPGTTTDLVSRLPSPDGGLLNDSTPPKGVGGGHIEGTHQSSRRLVSSKRIKRVPVSYPRSKISKTKEGLRGKPGP